MKYCEEYAALLDLFADGELPAEEMKRVGDHLAECPGCRAYVDDALAIRAGFPDAEDTVVPEGFAQGVMERIRKSGTETVMEPRRRAFRRWVGMAAALAACCALVVLVRTGPAGGDNSAAPAVGAAVYQNSDEAADDTAESLETGVAEPAAPAEAAKEAPAELRTTAGTEEAADQAPQSLAPAAAAPEAAKRSIVTEDTAALYLTAEEAGDLLSGFSAVWENAAEWRYELNGEEYRALLEALGRQEELPEEAEGPFLVVVTGPEE